MTKNYLTVVISFLFFATLQVLVLNHVHLFRLFLPLLYIYVIIKIPVNLTRIATILTAFGLGLVIDLFSNTPGLHASACTLIGAYRYPLLKALSEKEIIEGAAPSYQTIGRIAFFRYALSMIVLHHVALFLLESISLFDPLFLILRTVGSIVLTLLCVIVVEAFHIERKSGDT